MDCRNCEVRQRQLFCKTCIKTHLRDFHSQHTHYTNDLKLVVSTASSSLVNVVEPARTSRARVAEIHARVEQLVGGLNAARKDCERKRDRIRKLREDLAQRRRTLGAAKMIVRPSSSNSNSSTPTPTTVNSAEPVFHNPSNLAPLVSPILAYAASPGPATGPFLSTPSANHPSFPTSEPSPFVYSTSPTYPGSNPYATHLATLISTPIPASPYLSSLSQTLIRARSGLIQELVEVFNIVQVGGRPNVTVGGRNFVGARGEWTIGSGLVLPVPGDIRRYPPDHINAVLTLTLHFINLLSFYLGVKLPFEIVWSDGASSGEDGSAGKIGLGTPWIGAVRGFNYCSSGSEGGSWARWYTKQPLHLSNSSNAPTSSPNPPPLSHVPVPTSNSESEPGQSPTSLSFGLNIEPRAQPAQTSLGARKVPTSRRSLMGLAAGVVGYARARTFSSSSPSSSAPLVGERGPESPALSSSGRKDYRGPAEEEEDVETRLRQEKEMEASMMAAMPLPLPSLPPRSSTMHSGRRGSSSAKAPSTSSGFRANSAPTTPVSATLATSAASPSATPAAASSTSTSQPSFTTALAMLIYNVLYLAHTQGVDIPLNQSGEVLGNLWKVCCATEVGRYSNESGAYGVGVGGGAQAGYPQPIQPSTSSGSNTSQTSTSTPTPTGPSNPSSTAATTANAAQILRLPPPTPPSFTTDFGQVLQVISTAHRERWQKGARVVSGRKGTSRSGDVGAVGKIEEEFDFVERDVLGRAGAGSGGKGGDAGGDGERGNEKDRKSGEGGQGGDEGGWDLLEGGDI